MSPQLFFNTFLQLKGEMSFGVSSCSAAKSRQNSKSLFPRNVRTLAMGKRSSSNEVQQLASHERQTGEGRSCVKCVKSGVLCIVLLRAKPKTVLWSSPSWRWSLYRARSWRQKLPSALDRPTWRPPLFAKWIGLQHLVTPPTAYGHPWLRCRIQLRATLLRMRSPSETAHRSPESERNSAEQHRPPSIQQSFGHGDVCFSQSSSTFFFFCSSFLIFSRFLSKNQMSRKISEWIR